MKRIFILLLALPLMFGACEKRGDDTPEPEYEEIIVKADMDTVVRLHSFGKYDGCISVNGLHVEKENLERVKINFTPSYGLNSELGFAKFSGVTFVSLHFWTNQFDYIENEQMFHVKIKVRTKDYKIYIVEHDFKVLKK